MSMPVPLEPLANVSPNVVDLIEQLLCKDPAFRISWEVLTSAVHINLTSM